MISGVTTNYFLPDYKIVGENKEKRIFKINVGKLQDNDVEEYIKKIKEEIKLKPNE